LAVTLIVITDWKDCSSVLVDYSQISGVYGLPLSSRLEGLGSIVSSLSGVSRSSDAFLRAKDQATWQAVVSNACLQCERQVWRRERIRWNSWVSLCV